MRKNIIALLVILMLLAMSSASYAGMKKGPYLQMVFKTQATVVWETDSTAGGKVEWGLDNTLPETIDAEPGTMHHVKLSGLAPNTTYFYRVSSDGDTSSVYQFKSAPNPDMPYRFVAFGDSRSGYAEHTRVAEAILREDPSLYMNSGDIVSSGEDEPSWQNHFDIEKDLAAAKPMLPAIGNHDATNSEAKSYLKYFLMPPNGVGNADEYRGYFYHYDWGNTRFIGLDVTIKSLAVGSLQYEWLIQVLQDAARDPYILHVFLMAHEGPYTAKPRRSGNANFRAMIDTLAEYNVTCILSGHDHYYYRGQSANGVNFLVTGGGGAGLYECEMRADYGVVNEMCESVYNYVVFDVDGPNITAIAKTGDGEELERFAWTSPKPYVPYEEEDGDVPDETDGDVPNDGDVTDDPDDPDDPGDEIDDHNDFLDGDSPDPDSPAAYDPEYGFATGCQGVAIYGVSASMMLFGLALLFALRRKTKKID